MTTTNLNPHGLPVDRTELIELVRSIVDMDDIFCQPGETRLADATQGAYRAIKRRAKDLYTRLEQTGELPR